MSQERLFGLKKLSPKTWLDIDEAMSYFVIEHADSRHRSSSLFDNWASQVFVPELGPKVPDDVRVLYEVARGATLYAVFYYPLMTLASEQLYRVADAALSHRLDDLNQSKTFADRIKIAVKLNIISPARINSWEATRELRNQSSHATGQSVVMPGWALQMLVDTAELINELYA